MNIDIIITNSMAIYCVSILVFIIVLLVIIFSMNKISIIHIIDIAIINTNTIITMVTISPDPSSHLGSLGDLVRRLSSVPHGASYGLLWGLTGDTKWTY